MVFGDEDKIILELVRIDLDRFLLPYNKGEGKMVGLEFIWKCMVCLFRVAKDSVMGVEAVDVVLGPHLVKVAML